MYNSNKFRGFLSAALTFSLFVTGCSLNSNTDSSKDKSAASSSDASSGSDGASIENMSSSSSSAVTRTDVFSERDLSPEYGEVSAEILLNGDSVEISGKGAVCEGSEVTITDEGVYLISGTLDDGQIIVDSDGKVQLVLADADITCLNSAPVYIVNADKTFITLPEGTENTLTDGSDYLYEDETANEPDAAVFSADSLTINGSGTLNISGNYNEGISSKDDIVITGGTINVKSSGNGIKGKDYVAVCNAELNIEAGGDGIKSDNTDDMSLGFVYVQSGAISITAQEDGIQAETDFISDGGTFSITSGGGYEAAEPKQNNDFGGRGGFFGQNSSDTDDTTDTSVSTKGIKGSVSIDINGGEFNINSADDALHSNGDIIISDGTLSLSAGDDGIHSDLQINISGGSIAVSESYEGIESAVINITGGIVEVKSSDDGFNASDGTSQGAMGNYSSGAQLNISGGIVYVDAGGDGLDSNGDMTISGGTVIINGPENSGNGALDGNNEIIVNGGLLIAAGSSGMAEAPGNSSAQHSVSAAFEQTYAAGTLVTLCTQDGSELISFAPSKSFSHIVISSPDIRDGETYTIYTGGASSAEEKYGLYESGGYNGKGTEACSFTADDITSYAGSQQGMMGGGFGGGRGNHENMQPPTDENGEMTIPDEGFGGRGNFEMPTDENGDPQMPEKGFQGGGMRELPTDTDGDFDA